MNIFISWSGDLSKQIGEVFRDWMPKVIQNIKPYFTPSDIEKGSKWETEISKKLSDCTVGVIILTKDNLDSSWIMFEAGSLSNKLDKSRVCPVLFEIENTDLTGPLATFQTTRFIKDDIRKLMGTVNDLCGDNKLSDRVFSDTFEMFWPTLDKDIYAIITLDKETKKYKSVKKIRTDREILDEILEHVRMNSIRNEGIIRDRGIRRYEDLPYVNKQKLKEIVLDYLFVKGIKVSEYETLDKDEICEYLDRNQKVRDLVYRKEILRRFLDDFVNLLH